MENALRDYTYLPYLPSPTSQLPNRFYVGSLAKNGSISDNIRLYLSRQPNLHNISAKKIAKQVHMSERSLYRQLKSQNFRLKDLVNWERRRRLDDLVRQGVVSAAELAEVLGYKHVQSFYRGFYQWMGCSFADYIDNRRGNW